MTALETRQDHFNTSCDCEVYKQFVICLNGPSEKDYSCVEDFNACPGASGSYPVFIPDDSAALSQSACDDLLTWDICADEYDAICILTPLDCPLGYDVSRLLLFIPLDGHVDIYSFFQ